MGIKSSIVSLRRITRAMTPTNISMGLRYIARGNFSTLSQGIKKIAKRQTERNNKDILTHEILEIASILGEQTRNTQVKVTLVFDHVMGGGANSYRKNIISERLINGELVLLVTYQIWDDSYHLTYQYNKKSVSFTINSLQDLEWITKYVEIKEIFYNNLVSYPKTLDAVEIILQLQKAQKSSIILTVHDFYPICPSYTLLNREGNYCNIPDFETCLKCLPRNGYAFPRSIDSYDIKKWRDTWKSLVETSNEVLCFSESSKEIINKVFTIKPSQVKVQPHKLTTSFPVKPNYNLDNELCVGVIGIISYQKGAELLFKIAQILEKKSPKAKIVVIGTLESSKKRGNIEITGPYKTEELPNIIENKGVNVCFFSSIWPETFSYVCSEIMEMQMPLCCFNIGAPIERVKNYKLGNIISSIDPQVAVDEIIQFYEKLKTSNGRNQ